MDITHVDKASISTRVTIKVFEDGLMSIVVFRKVAQMTHHLGEKQEAQRASQRFLGSCDPNHMESYTRFAPLLLLLLRLSALSITAASLNQPC
jgi:hypothetical protein